MLSCPILYFLLKYTELSSEICVDTHRDSSAWHVLKSTFFVRVAEEELFIQIKRWRETKKTKPLQQHTNN